MARSPAEAHLAAMDPVLREVIARLGPCTLRRRRSDPFVSLVRSVVGQRVSSKAAETVYGRLVTAHGGPPTPAGLARLSEAGLRAQGLPRTKARAILALAEGFQTGELATLTRWRTERIHQALVALPGIGEWTVQMFLIFHLARPDVFPAGDLGVQEGMRRVYGLSERPTPKEARARAEVWAPYRSVGAWYMWRVLDGPAAL